MSNQKPLNLRGVLVYKSYLNAFNQRQLVNDVRKIVRDAPMFRPCTPSGKEMSVRMSAAGKYGWITDRHGYRYEPLHPNGGKWPDIPDSIIRIWDDAAGTNRQPDCCLINYYSDSAKMGMHQDKDEKDFDYPVVSISLGDSALFRIGNVAKGGKTESVWLESGDVCVLGGAVRLVHHGVDRIRFGSSGLLPKHGRINLTLRVVD